MTFLTLWTILAIWSSGAKISVLIVPEKNMIKKDRFTICEMSVLKFSAIVGFQNGLQMQ